uniref:Uncharacterized protein n=1 Tax=Anguilla anguilla TaxID=7936 RepID=A0A0E9RTB7_ANGAN
MQSRASSSMIGLEKPGYSDSHNIGLIASLRPCSLCIKVTCSFFLFPG